MSLLLACMAAACGGPSTPVQPSPTASADIRTGAYRLVLTMSTTGDPVCTEGGCATLSLCVSAAGAPLIGISMPIEVRAERTGDEVAIRPLGPSATLRLNLRIAGAQISGTAAGHVVSGGHVVSVDGGKPQSAAAVTGTTALVSQQPRRRWKVAIAGRAITQPPRRNLSPRWILAAGPVRSSSAPALAPE